MEEILIMTSTYGFPMIMAIYLLVRIESIIMELKESVDSLSLLVGRNGEPRLENYENHRNMIN